MLLHDITALQQLDQFFNDRLLRAPSAAEEREAWAAKVAAKRRLEGLPPNAVDVEAARILRSALGAFGVRSVLEDSSRVA